MKSEKLQEIETITKSTQETLSLIRSTIIDKSRNEEVIVSSIEKAIDNLMKVRINANEVQAKIQQFTANI